MSGAEKNANTFLLKPHIERHSFKFMWILWKTLQLTRIRNQIRKTFLLCYLCVKITECKRHFAWNFGVVLEFICSCLPECNFNIKSYWAELWLASTAWYFEKIQVLRSIKYLTPYYPSTAILFPYNFTTFPLQNVAHQKFHVCFSLKIILTVELLWFPTNFIKLPISETQKQSVPFRSLHKRGASLASPKWHTHLLTHIDINKCSSLQQ